MNYKVEKWVKFTNISLRQEILSGFVKAMAIVPAHLKQFEHNILPLPLHGRYHRGHGAAVNQELHPVNVQALVHKGDQTGVCLQEGGVVLLKLHPCV